MKNIFGTTTAAQDREFIASIFPSSLLEDAILWISKNMSPENVFSEEKLKSWAEDNDMVDAE